MLTHGCSRICLTARCATSRLHSCEVRTRRSRSRVGESMSYLPHITLRRILGHLRSIHYDRCSLIRVPRLSSELTSLYDVLHHDSNECHISPPFSRGKYFIKYTFDTCAFLSTHHLPFEEALNALDITSTCSTFYRPPSRLDCPPHLDFTPADHLRCPKIMTIRRI